MKKKNPSDYAQAPKNESNKKKNSHYLLVKLNTRDRKYLDGFRKHESSKTIMRQVLKTLSLKLNIFLLVLFCFLACHKGPEFHIIHFVGDVEIAESDSVLLYENLETIEGYADIEVELAGYTDAVGSDSYNLARSQIRADTIKSWLLQQGIDSLRLIAIGYGEANPIADNRTTEGRAQNNRVEFIER